MTGVLMMKNEEIAQKLDKLTLLYQQLKALREAQGEEFSPEDEDLLSHAELLEEALKNYMYQFGLSIYRNKKGKRFFKKFIHEEDEVRGFDELDNQCFEFQEAEPSFLQRLLEYKPADRILMTKDVESTVEELYEKDQQMIDIFDELLNEEAERCTDIIKESEIEADIEKTFQIQNEITTPEIAVELDAPNIDLADIEKDIIHEEPAPERTPVKIINAEPAMSKTKPQKLPKDKPDASVRKSAKTTATSADFCLRPLFFKKHHIVIFLPSGIIR